MKKELSFEQRVHNALGSKKVEEFKARHAYLHGVFYSREEFGDGGFWYDSINTSWAHQFGRMVGPEEIRLNSIEHFDRMAVTMKLDIMTKYPQIVGHDIRSVCSSGAHALCSDVIEVAEDGKSARSFFLTPGTLMSAISYFDPSIRGSEWLWERYGSDFIYDEEEQRWYWFHEQVCPDIYDTYDAGNWARDLYAKVLDGSISIGEVGGDPAQLSEPGLIHADYSITQTVQNTVPPPEPYKTMDADHTYSPGRWDKTGKVTVKIEHAAVANHDKSFKFPSE